MITNLNKEDINNFKKRYNNLKRNNNTPINLNLQKLRKQESPTSKTLKYLFLEFLIFNK